MRLCVCVCVLTIIHDFLASAYEFLYLCVLYVCVCASACVYVCTCVVFVDVCQSYWSQGFSQPQTEAGGRSLRDTEEDFQFNKTISKYIRNCGLT